MILFFFGGSLISLLAVVCGEWTDKTGDWMKKKWYY